jgi:hypothetical protein
MEVGVSFSFLMNLQAGISNFLPDFTPRNVLLRISSLDGREMI